MAIQGAILDVDGTLVLSNDSHAQAWVEAFAFYGYDESAKKAGVGVIAFRSGGFSDNQLKDALAIYNDPADLAAKYEDSPLVREAIVKK